MSTRQQGGRGSSYNVTVDGVSADNHDLKIVNDYILAYCLVAGMGHFRERNLTGMPGISRELGIPGNHKENAGTNYCSRTTLTRVPI